MSLIWCAIFPPACLYEWTKQAMEKLSVGAGIVPLTETQINEIKGEVAEGIRHAGGSELDVAQAMQEIDRHVDKLAQQIPNPPPVVGGAVTGFLDRFEGVIYGVAIGLVAYFAITVLPRR